MRLVKSYEDSSKAVFCAFELDRSNNNKKEFIVVTNLDSDDPFYALKKRFVADFLEFVATTDRDIDWAEIDSEISAIMRAKFHTI